MTISNELTTLLIIVLGLVLYAQPKYPKISEIGKLTFFAALLALLMHHR